MKSLCAPLFLLISFSAFAQTTLETTKITNETKVEIDERLYDVFDANYLEKLQTVNPFVIQRWNFYLDNAWYITDYPEAKGTPNYQSISVVDLENLNILKLEKEQTLRKDFEKQMMYQIEGTQKVLVYHSGRKFNQMLNEHLGRKH